MSALTTARRRSGFTLVELVVALSLALVVGGAVASVLVRQQRFYNDAGRLVEGRQQVAAALAIPPADLRSLSPRAGDVTAIAGDSVQFRLTTGAGIACGAGGSAALDLPPTHPSNGSPLVAWTSAPRAGDTLLVYDVGDSTRPERWTAHAVTALATGTAYCGATAPFVSPADAGLPRSRLHLDPSAPLPSGAGAGSAVRILRHVRYKLYRAGDSRWYLGYTDYRAGSGWAVVQPVSGPYEPPSGSGAESAPFRFHDAAGLPVTDARREELARVTIVARARPEPASGGRGLVAPADSLVIALRNPHE